MLGLCCCTRLSLVAASGDYSLSQRAVSHCHGFCCCRAQALGAQASVVVAHRCSSCGLQALECRLALYGIFLDQGSILCIARWILNHRTTRETLFFSFLRKLHTVLVAVSIHTPTNCVGRFPSLHPWSAFVVYSLFNDSHSDWYEVMSPCSFDLHFFDD